MFKYALTIKSSRRQKAARLINGDRETYDWTGHTILENKRSSISGNQPPILERLQIDPQRRFYMPWYFESHFKGLVGMSYSLKAVCRKFGNRRTPNLGSVLHLLMPLD